MPCCQNEVCARRKKIQPSHFKLRQTPLVQIILVSTSSTFFTLTFCFSTTIPFLNAADNDYQHHQWMVTSVHHHLWMVRPTPATTIHKWWWGCITHEQMVTRANNHYHPSQQGPGPTVNERWWAPMTTIKEPHQMPMTTSNAHGDYQQMNTRANDTTHDYDQSMAHNHHHLQQRWSSTTVNNWRWLTPITTIHKPCQTLIHEPCWMPIHELHQMSMHSLCWKSVHQPCWMPIHQPRGTPIHQPRWTPIHQPCRTPIHQPCWMPTSTNHVEQNQPARHHH